MSEPITPDQAIEIVATQYERTGWHKLTAVADLIRTLAARNAELEFANAMEDER